MANHIPLVLIDGTTSQLPDGDLLLASITGTSTGGGGGGGSGDALTTNPLSQFAATTSAQLRGVITDETGTGSLVFSDAPALGSFTATSLNNVAITAPSPVTLTVSADASVSGTNTGDQTNISGNAATATFATTAGSATTATTATNADHATTSDSATTAATATFATTAGSATTATNWKKIALGATIS